MTLLRTMSDQDPDTVLLATADRSVIADRLAGLGIVYEQWTADQELADAAGSEEVLAAYQDDVDRLCAAGGYLLVDVARMRRTGDDPDWPAKAAGARERFREEHSHAQDEVRFFVEGRGCFYLHVDGQVHAVVCEAGDLLSVPAGTVHWFDMGAEPCFTAIRFFQREDGWVADFAPESIASRFPDLDQIMAGQG
jgi:1,2-dihydroxy-3-keto-5-methylthiopentene dioxygenase